MFSSVGDVTERREAGVLPIRDDLKAYYKGKTCSKIGNFTVGIQQLRDRGKPLMGYSSSIFAFAVTEI